MFFSWYESTVYKQFIKDQRHFHDGCQPDAAVSDSNIIASWFDGEMTQLLAHTQAARLDENLKHKIRDCKHSASRTAEEQGCDCARCFATIKKIQAKTTLKDRSAPIKQVIINTLQDFKRDGILCFPAIKNAVINPNLKNWHSANSCTR